MPEAWELVPETERTFDQITTFILFCEDDVNEPAYFRQFAVADKVKVNPVENQKATFRNINNTLQYCEANGLLDVAAGHYRLKPGTTTHVWSVFDRDVESEDRIAVLAKDNLDFSLSIQTAASAGFQVAWTNDVFELWILLHFEDVAPGVWRHRNYIYNRLTAIFQTLPDQSPEMAAITERANFRYEVHFKREKHFVPYVLPYLAGRTESAIQRAQQLEAAFPATHRLHDCNPCTKVHHLVRSLRSFA